jgi:hypothetical protein
MAKHLIAYKQKISEEWLEKQNKDNKNDVPKDNTSDNETSKDPVYKKLTKSIKINLKPLNFIF